ncbi:MAG: hypothetical protein LAQ30_27440 [Acidobacteriia bacterium]|nr:hypothetical protein [Terriglobia bacterium]
MHFITGFRKPFIGGVIAMLCGVGAEVAEPAQSAPIIRGTDPAGPAPVTRTVVRRRHRRRRTRRYVVVRKRPFKHSAAIVGGSAAGGAAIGALAGGGKGAAIGALAGGAGGLIYDRATHKKKVVVRR